MRSMPPDSGEMSQDLDDGTMHLSRVQADALLPAPPAPRVMTPAIDPAARSSRRMYEGLSASSVGLELGLAVIIALLVGMWLDRQLGTQPWLMLVFLILGLVAGFRNVLRAVARAEKTGHG
jgi:F0F1-type ATP synthase assembly protein I